MFGLPSATKAIISSQVEDIFDRIALSLLGEIPALKHKKLMVFSAEPNMGLANLFVQSLNSSSPNPLEQDVLKGLLKSTYSYIDALKSKTSANITEAIDGLVKEAKVNKTRVPENALDEIIKEEMKKARSQLTTIVETESTKLRNVGKSMQIVKMAGSIGDSNPSLFFICTHDNVTCKECLRLHLMPDGVTPRVWKFNELNHGYHKRGGDRPSILGLHPNERCVLTYLTPGFGFNEKGLITYVKKNYSLYDEQRNE